MLRRLRNWRQRRRPSLRKPGLFLAVTESLLADGYSVRFRAEGTSMTPFVRPGSALTVSPEPPKEGELALFKRGARPIAHTLAGPERAVDASGADEVLSPGAILGRASTARTCSCLPKLFRSKGGAL